MAESDHKLDLLLLGDSGVGKTCILNRFSNNTFTPDYMNMIGTDFKIENVEINGKKVKLQLWDTAGQERFHELQAQYYRRAQGVLLVYDITERVTFSHITKWVGNIEQNAPSGVQTILVGNKCDLEEKRAVSTEMGENLAAEHNIPFIETSAKSGLNVREAFYNLVGVIMEKVPLEIARKKSKSILRIRKSEESPDGGERSSCCSS